MFYSACRTPAVRLCQTGALPVGQSARADLPPIDIEGKAVTSSSVSSRNAPAAVTAALIVLGVLFAAAGAVYLAKTAAQLPAFFPGHQAGSAHHHTKHALVAFALAAVSWVGAWLSTGTRTRQQVS